MGRRAAREKTLTLCLAVLLHAAAVCGQDMVADEAESIGEEVRFASQSWPGTELTAVFRHLSEAGGVDIVLDPGVQGKLSLTVTDKTWLEVFQIICKIKQLHYVKEGGYIYVMTEREYHKQLQEKENNKNVFERVLPLRREVVRVSNMEAGEMRNAVAGLKSSRGSITLVDYSNSLIIEDIDEKLAQIKEMIATLDVEVAQVSIAAKIVEVSSGTMQTLGIQWGFFGQPGGRQASAEHLPSGVIGGALDRLSYGILTEDNFAATLEYLFQENRGEIVAQPSITTLDNKQADIYMTEKVKVVSDNYYGSSVTYVDAKTGLTVTPNITDGSQIRLNVLAQKESPDPDGNIKTQKATTNVVVKDGETVVIAGLTSNKRTESESGIPFLKDIPILGNLFKRSNKSVANADLIIFITPHIIRRELDRAGPRASADEDVSVDPGATQE